MCFKSDNVEIVRDDNYVFMNEGYNVRYTMTIATGKECEYDFNQFSRVLFYISE